MTDPIQAIGWLETSLDICVKSCHALLMGRHPPCAYPNIALPSRQMASCPQAITCSRSRVCRHRAWCSRTHRPLHGMEPGVPSWLPGLAMPSSHSGPQEPEMWSLTAHSSRTPPSRVMSTGSSSAMSACWQTERSRRDSTRSTPPGTGRGMRAAVDVGRGHPRRNCRCGMLGAWTSIHFPCMRELLSRRSGRSSTSCSGVAAAMGGPRESFGSCDQPSGGRHDQD